MGNPSFLNKFYIGKEASYGATAGTPERLIALTADIRKVPRTTDVEGQATGTKVGVTDTILSGRGSTVNITGVWYAEHTPLFMSLLLGGTTGTNPQLVKDIEDASETNPDQVASYVSSVPVDQESIPNNYSLFYRRSGKVYVIRGIYATSLTITAEAGSPAQISLDLAGHGPELYTTAITTEPVEVDQLTPVIVTEQTTSVGGTALVKKVKRTVIRIDSGFVPEDYADGGLNTSEVVGGTRNCEIQLRTKSDTDADALRAIADEVGKEQIEIVFNGPNIRTSPEIPRAITIGMYGQFSADTGGEWEDDNEQTVNNFTISSRASDTDRDIEVTAVVANDAGGVV